MKSFRELESRRSPRLLYIDDIPTPYRIGVQRAVARLWKGSFKVLFCAESEAGRTWDLDLHGFDYKILRGTQWRPSGQINPHSFKYNSSIVKELVVYDPDFVILCGYSHPTMIRAAGWCLRHKVPYAITCETSDRSTATSGLRWFVRRSLIGWMVTRMAFGLPTGQDSAAYLQKLGAKSAQMHYFPNTPDTRPFCSAASLVAQSADIRRRLRARYSLLEQGPIFLFVGRLIDAKRPLDAINAFLALDPFTRGNLVIIGDGPLMPVLMTIAAAEKDIIFTGWISNQDEIAKLMALATALLLPSHHEPWGAVVNESMAAGTPVIASEQVGAARELIEHSKDGFLVGVGDVEAIADAMRSLLIDRDKAEEVSKNAQRKATSFGEDFASANLIEGVQSFLASP